MGTSLSDVVSQGVVAAERRRKADRCSAVLDLGLQVEALVHCQRA